MLRLSRRRQTRANGADLSATSCKTFYEHVCPACECAKCGVRVFVVYGKSEIRTVNGINIETLLPPHASKYMVLSTPYHTKSSGPFCCLHNFNFCGTIPFPFCRVIVSSADAPSKRNERLYGRNDGVFVFWILLHSSLQSQPVTASYQLAVSIYQLAMWPVVKCFCSMVV